MTSKSKPVSQPKSPRHCTETSPLFHTGGVVSTVNDQSVSSQWVMVYFFCHPCVRTQGLSGIWWASVTEVVRGIWRYCQAHGSQEEGSLCNGMWEHWWGPGNSFTAGQPLIDSLGSRPGFHWVALVCVAVSSQRHHFLCCPQGET